MKNLIFVFLALGALALTSFSNDKNDKVVVRHKGEPLEISVNALHGHLEHGDVIVPVVIGIGMGM